ncbi:hypothetical protein KUG85_04580 [Nitratireductor sp. L1-7-SE]|uniref:Blue (type 1) copper domain-containing protein n=2 Tax=Nitratireductor rhodophyticola TaxID=2854036 RepID=A0ABS7R2T1_9HYPH|nr:plastocyanin/azurin family copper-binding protein [Nitratireductor rhodophyticola]MBY8914964.1 hypothetical protein [Nitratireductor rhodophyticola]MBY8919966.1 hypothetical protein [Nitratireductor rhodophyticola]
MKPSRRRFLQLGGGLAATLATARTLHSAPLEVIEMRGTPRGERIWFSPVGLAVAPGTVLRFVNRDPVNSHTATAYHPENFDRKRRIPLKASPWDSGFLLPEESFEVVLDVPGVYDYHCIPHEMAGMVGRIVVGQPDTPGFEDASSASDDLPPGALEVFPAVPDILARGRIEGDAG